MWRIPPCGIRTETGEKPKGKFSRDVMGQGSTPGAPVRGGSVTFKGRRFDSNIFRRLVICRDG